MNEDLPLPLNLRLSDLRFGEEEELREEGSRSSWGSVSEGVREEGGEEGSVMEGLAEEGVAFASTISKFIVVTLERSA